MNILAVRVSEVGCFNGAVALEGLTPGLNILAGHNEAGKSTILAALRMAFEQPHTTLHRDVKALRPYSGGAPRVEVDFECAGSSWRLSKQYLTGRSAELRNLSTGQVSRGKDAENHLSELLTKAGGNPSLALLWANQSELLDTTVPDKAVIGLKAAIDTEVKATVGGSQARRVHQQVREELAQLLTPSTKKPKGEYLAVLKECADLEYRVSAAQDRLDASVQRLQTLAQLRQEDQALSDPATLAARKAALDKAKDAYTKGEEAARRHQTAASAASSATSALELARSKHENFAAALKQLQELEEAKQHCKEERTRLEQEVASADAAASDARTSRDTRRSDLEALAREREHAMQAGQIAQARARLAKLEEAHAIAKDVIAQGRSARKERDSISMTTELLRGIRKAYEGVRKLEDQLAAAAPVVGITYLPGAESRITSQGKPVAPGEHHAGQPLVLEIDGIGTITIAPGASGEAHQKQKLLAQFSEERDRLLRQGNVTSMEEAEHALERRVVAESTMAEARARFDGVAPEGIEALLAEVNALKAQLEDAPDLAGEEIRLAEQIAHDLEQARSQLKTADQALENCQSELAGKREALARHEAAAADQDQRLTRLQAELPPASDRKNKLEALEQTLEQATAALNAAVREETAWRESAPDDETLTALRDTVERCESAVQNATDQRAALRQKIAGLEGELRADQNDDVEARAGELQGRLQSAKRRLQRLKDDADALSKLDDELSEQEQRSRDTYLEPVTARLQPYLNLLLPDAALTMADDFSPGSLARQGTREPVAALSGGTKEQLAVLVRLAFGRLMAESGKPVPVILDDVLVYADDERITRMFAALIEAARHQQVIVLTCRERTFRALDGHRLTIIPWGDTLPRSSGAVRLAASGR